MPTTIVGGVLVGLVSEGKSGKVMIVNVRRKGLSRVDSARRAVQTDGGPEKA